MYNIIKVPGQIIEPLIALSIMYVALENIFSPRLKASRIGVVFVFGLVHGLGFAGALGELGLPKNAYLVSLIMFNVGVELGQLTIILLAYFLLARWFGNKPYYRKSNCGAFVCIDCIDCCLLDHSKGNGQLLNIFFQVGYH